MVVDGVVGDVVPRERREHPGPDGGVDRSVLGFVLGLELREVVSFGQVSDGSARDG